MDVKQFFIKAQDAFQLIKKARKSTNGRLFVFLILNLVCTTQKNNQKNKKMTKKVDRWRRKVYNITIKNEG